MTPTYRLYLQEQIVRLNAKVADSNRYDKRKDGYGRGKSTNQPDVRERDGLQDVRDAIAMYEKLLADDPE